MTHRFSARRTCPDMTRIWMLARSDGELGREPAAPAAVDVVVAVHRRRGVVRPEAAPS